jgi:putative FmdB family regulatory protein
MPIYEYVCPDCEESFEVFVNITENSKEMKCKKCGGTAKKKISSSSFLLKGNGWAKDGYSKCGSKG